MFVRKLSLALGCFAVLVARAQDPMNAPAPLVATATGPTAGANLVSFATARRALELGFPGIAAETLRGLVDAPGVDRVQVTLTLATALIDDAHATEAQTVLNALKDPRGSPWRLRAGLAWVQLRRLDLAAAEFAQTKLEDLSPADRSWYYYLQGRIVEQTDLIKAKDLYNQAENAAPTMLARARFKLWREQAELRAGAPMDDAQLAAQKDNFEKYRGTDVGYSFGRTYAVALNARGRKSDAVNFIRREILGTMPPTERVRTDAFRLMVGLIAGPETDTGRGELTRLAEAGLDLDLQRMALQLLAERAKAEPARGQLRGLLEKIVAQKPSHPARAEALLFHAQLVLGEKGYAAAEDDAQKLLDEFPASPLRPQALSVLIGSAWEQRRYLRAAQFAAQAREALPSGPARAQLGLLVAEASFRAGTFRSAADAYAALGQELPLPPGVDAGEIMFRRVDAEIRAGTLEPAQKLLNDFARDPAFGAENRWKAEWNLAKALQVDNQSQAALARVRALVSGTEGAALKPELRARMKWLHAQLSLDAGHPQDTEALVKDLASELGALPADLQRELASSGQLLLAEALLKLDNQEVRALEVLKKLRTDYAKTDAAAYSFIIEAYHYAERDNISDAQGLFNQLVDNPDYQEEKFNRYAAFALYQESLQLERLGTDKGLEDADKLVERLVTERRFANSELIFAARLRQGDLLRKLALFPQAETAYRDLIAKFPRNSNTPRAMLSLAECVNAQSNQNPAQTENALQMFLQLRELADAPEDVRVEAGYNYGRILKRRGDLKGALDAWWEVVDAELFRDPTRGSRLLAPTSHGPYWLARTLWDFGDASQEASRPAEARRAWQLIVDKNLPWAEAAKQRLNPPAAVEGKP